MVYNWINSIQDQVYPAACSLCGSKGLKNLDLCAPCRDQLPYNLHPCSRCALPLPVANNSTLCGQCTKQTPLFQRVYAPFLFQPPMDHLIRSLKFCQQLATGRLLGGLLADHLQQLQYPLPQIILPVPLHNRQLRQRGFNQSAELARYLATELEIDWSAGLLRKIRHTQPQHGLNKTDRAKNLRHCFKFQNSRHLTHVAVVDDVVTTTSTATEITRTLKRQGVKQVQIWALARTP